MAPAKQTALPPMVPFPEAAWRQHLLPEEWEACLDAWIVLAQAHLSFSMTDFLRISVKDESVAAFLTSYAYQQTISQDNTPSIDLSRAKKLRKLSFLLCVRLLGAESPPEPLLQWEFLADFSKIYSRTYTKPVFTSLWKTHRSSLEISMSLIKATLVNELDAGIKGDLKNAETQIKRLNHLLHVSPHAAALFTAGSDFMDALISGYKVMNPPLRKVIISATYLCLMGLTEGEEPNFSSLIDVLYSLKAAGDAHKAGSTSVNDSLVAELVTVTPILKQLQHRIKANGSKSMRAKSVLSALGDFRKPAPSGRPPRPRKKKIDKGKGIANGDVTDDEFGHRGEIHVHRMSLISEIQDLFPDLGAGFIMKLLDEYDENVELVISHLLEGTLPPHLDGSDRREGLPTFHPKSSLTPHSPTLPALPTRHNIHDNDALDTLSIPLSQLHIGRRNASLTADSLLQDRTTAPSKAAILSALAAFDSDDDERDDTYDVEDVGGTVDAGAPGDEEASGIVREGQRRSQQQREEENGYDEVLWRAWKVNSAVFARDAGTRRGKEREALKKETGLTDEAVEGWAVMLGRDPGRLRRMERRFADKAFLNPSAQRELGGTRWRSGEDTGTGTEDEAGSGAERGGYRGGGGMGRGGRPTGRGGARGRGGDVSGQTGDQGTEAARKRKEANKGSRVNHNRRDQRARKMARGGM